MRKKRITFILIFLILMIIFSGNIKANQKCLYKNFDAQVHKTDSGLFYEIDLDELKQQQLNSAWKKFPLYSPNKKFSKTTNVKNWFSAHDASKFPFVAKDYVEKNNQCPPFALITSGNVAYYAFLSDELTCGDPDVIEALKGYKSKTHCWTLTLDKYLSNDDKEKQEKHEVEDNSKSCLDWTNDEDGCVNNGRFSCLWISGGGSPGYCNTDDLQYIKCGGAFDIPEQAPRIMSFAINLLKIGTPIILIITGIITLVKAVAASKEDDMKKAQSALIRKAVAAALVFFVISIVQFVLLSVADSGDESSISTCLSCFMNNDCDSNVYYKTKVLDKYVCHLVSNPAQEIVCGENDDLVGDTNVPQGSTMTDTEKARHKNSNLNN